MIRKSVSKIVSIVTSAASMFAMLGVMPVNAELMRDIPIYTPEGRNPVYVTDSVPFKTPFYVDGVEHTANLYFGFMNDAVNPKDGYLEVHTETVFIFEFQEDIPVTADTVLDFGKISVMDIQIKDETIDNHLLLDFAKDAKVYALPCDSYDGTYAIPEYTGETIHKGDTMMVSVETETDKGFYFFYDSFEYLFVGGNTYCKVFTGNRSIGEMVYEVSKDAPTVIGQHCYNGYENLIATMNQLTLPEAAKIKSTEPVAKPATEAAAIPETETYSTKPAMTEPTQPETAIEVIPIPTRPFAVETGVPAETGSAFVSDIEGDADGDGVLDIVDVMSINKVILGLGTVKRPDLADINKNGIIDSNDKLLVLKKVLRAKK